MTGAKVVRHARSVIFQIAGLAVLWEKSELTFRGGAAIGCHGLIFKRTVPIQKSNAQYPVRVCANFTNTIQLCERMIATRYPDLDLDLSFHPLSSAGRAFTGDLIDHYNAFGFTQPITMFPYSSLAPMLQRFIEAAQSPCESRLGIRYHRRLPTAALCWRRTGRKYHLYHQPVY